MRHHDDGHLRFVPEPLHQCVDFGTNTRIKRAEGLIEQQHLRLHDEGLRQRQALLHSAGKLRRIFVLGAGKTDFADQPPGFVDGAAAR